MSPSEQHPGSPYALTVSDAGYQVTEDQYSLQQTRALVKQREWMFAQALLDAVMYAGMSLSSLSRLTGLSRRQIARLLRRASELPNDDV